MRLIIENDLDIRMKLPAQRAQLDALRQQMGGNKRCNHDPYSHAGSEPAHTITLMPSRPVR